MQNVLQHWISFSDLNPPPARQNQNVQRQNRIYQFMPGRNYTIPNYEKQSPFYVRSDYPDGQGFILPTRENGF